MAEELSLPLAEIIKRAASLKIEGPAAKIKKRFENATDEIVCLLDNSSSMTDLVGHSNLSKHDHLVIALKDVLQSFPKIRLVSFGNHVRELKRPEDLRPPCGGTPLCRALLLAAKWKPRKTIVLSDGLPDPGTQTDCVEAAERLTGSIDTIYCGPDSHPAVEFLRKLAKDTGGVDVTWDGYKPLSHAVRGLLPAPE